LRIPFCNADISQAFPKNLEKTNRNVVGESLLPDWREGPKKGRRRGGKLTEECKGRASSRVLSARKKRRSREKVRIKKGTKKDHFKDPPRGIAQSRGRGVRREVRLQGVKKIERKTVREGRIESKGGREDNQKKEEEGVLRNKPHTGVLIFVEWTKRSIRKKRRL